MLSCSFLSLSKWLLLPFFFFTERHLPLLFSLLFLSLSSFLQLAFLLEPFFTRFRLVGFFGYSLGFPCGHLFASNSQLVFLARLLIRLT